MLLLANFIENPRHSLIPQRLDLAHMPSIFLSMGAYLLSCRNRWGEGRKGGRKIEIVVDEVKRKRGWGGARGIVCEYNGQCFLRLAGGFKNGFMKLITIMVAQLVFHYN